MLRYVCFRIYSRSMWKVSAFPHIWPIIILTVVNELCSSAAGIGVSESAICWCEGGLLPQKNNLPPPVHSLMQRRLLRVSVPIYDATYGCEKWTTERFFTRSAKVTAHSHWLLYFADQLIDVNFPIHFLAGLAIVLTDSCGLTCRCASDSSRKLLSIGPKCHLN
jgi:hypothetical protein